MPWLTPVLSQWQQRRQAGRLGHALMVMGRAGVGKAELAEQIAARLLCQTGEGCGHCKACQLLANGSHPDRFDLKPDGQQIKVDGVRQLIGQLEGTAHQGGARVVVLHQAQRMNTAAANALLKTLEEPMPGVYLLLLVDQPSVLLPTISSRCQRLVVPDPTAAEVQQYLGMDADALSEWPYWQRLLGGPRVLAQWVEEGMTPKILQWRQAWRTSLKHGLLEPELGSVAPEQGAVMLKVLYFELLDAAKKRPERAVLFAPLLSELQDTAALLERQSGFNLTPLCQQLLAKIPRQHGGA
ncbi:DNA polymerase III subunit delta' [Ferrimonas marina]|nr:DNA polymerase III subunit delta' [Ferrimonas marina]